MEFEWKIFPQFTTAGILNEIQKMMGESQCDPADFKDRIIFMSMFDDIVWDATGNEELCENNSKKKLKNALEDFLAVIGLSLGLVQKRSGTSWDRTAEQMIQKFQRSKDSGHSMFRCTSALERGQSRSKA